MSILNTIENLIANKLAKQQVNNHEDIRWHLIRPILDLLGYDGEDADQFENEKNWADMKIRVCGTMLLIIEIKAFLDNKGKPIELKTEENVRQIYSYMETTVSDWGILTNGRRYILISKNITTVRSIMERIVLDIDLSQHSDTLGEKKYIDYLTKDNLYISKKTTYFEWIAKYKAYRNPISSTWENYKSTLFNFFDYIAKERYPHEVKDIETITFEDYLAWVKDKDYSVATFNNKQRYIHSFYEGLRINRLIPSHRFKMNIKDGKVNQDEEKIFKLTDTEIHKILESIGNRKGDIKYQVFFALNVFTGRTLKEIYGLKWEDIKINKNTTVIKFDGNRVKFKGVIHEMLTELKSQEAKETEYIFETKYEKKVRRLTKGNFSEKYRFMGKELGYTKFTTEIVTKALIQALFEGGWSIDNILYLTGKRLENISRYISTQQIYERCKCGSALDNKIKSIMKDVII